MSSVSKLSEAFLELEAKSRSRQTLNRLGQQTLGVEQEPEEISYAPQGLGQVFADAVRGGTAQLTSDFNRFSAIGSTLTGDTQKADNSLAIANSFDEYSSEVFNQIQPFESFLNEPTVGGFFTQVVKSIGQFTPMATSSIASGFGGAAVGLLGKTTLRAGSKFAVNKMYEEAAKKAATNPALLSASERAILNEGYGYLKYMKRGGVAGAFGQEYVIGSAQSAAEFEEAGRELTPLEAYQSLLLGVPQAALGTASEVVFANALLKNALAGTPLAKLNQKVKLQGEASLTAKEAAAFDIVKKINNGTKLSADESRAIAKFVGPEKNMFANLITDLGKGFAVSGTTEGITEIAQEGLQIGQRFAIDDKYTAAEAKLRLAEAGFAGFFAGGARGGAGGIATSIINQARAYTEQGQAVEAQINNERVSKGEGETFSTKTSAQINAEIEAGKSAVFLPGIDNINQVPAGTSLSKFQNLDSIPHQGGLLVGEEQALKPVRNLLNKKDISGAGNNANNFEAVNDAVSTLLNGEDINGTEPADTIVTATNSEGIVIATKKTDSANKDSVKQELEQRYPNAQVSDRPISETIEERNMTNMFEDFDLDDPEVQQAQAEGTVEEEAVTEPTIDAEDINPEEITEDQQTLPPEVIRRTVVDEKTNQVKGLEETPISYAKTNFIPDPNSTKAEDQELIRLRQEYIDQLQTAEEKAFWNPEVGPKPVNQLSGSALRQFNQQKKLNKDLVIGTSPNDSSRFSFFTYADQSAQTQIQIAVTVAVLEAIRNSTQATDGWQVKVTDPNAPAKIGFGNRKVDFANSTVDVNMQTLLNYGLRTFQQEAFSEAVPSAGTFDRALASTILPILETLKANGYVVQVRDAEGNFVDAVDQANLAVTTPIVNRQQGAVSAETLLQGPATEPVANQQDREQFRTIFEQVKEENQNTPINQAVVDVAKSRYQAQGGNMAIFKGPNENYRTSADIAITEFDSSQQIETDDQTELERMQDQPVEVEGPTNPGDRKLPSTRINIESTRSGFTESVQRRGNVVDRTTGRRRAQETRRAAQAQAARAQTRVPPFQEPTPTVTIEEGIEASDRAASIFDLRDAAGSFVSGKVFIEGLSKKFTSTFKSKRKVFVVSSNEDVQFAFDNKTYKDANGNEISPNDLIKQKQTEMQSNTDNFGKVISFGNASVIILNENSVNINQVTRTEEGIAGQILLSYALGHELGHVLYKQEIGRLKQNKNLFDSLYKAFLADRDKKNVKQYDGEFGFEEWYSDQMSMHLLDQAQTVGRNKLSARVYSYFDRLAKAIKRFFGVLHTDIQNRYGQGINPQFNEYVNGITQQYKNGLTPEEIPISVKQSIQIDDMVAGAENFIGSFVGRKNAVRFGAQMKKILTSVTETQMAKDITDFTYRYLAPADNYLRRLAPGLGRALYSRSQSQERMGYFNKYPLIQNEWQSKFYAIFNFEGFNPTDAELTFVDQVLAEAEALAALPESQRSNPTYPESLKVLEYFDDFWENYIAVREPGLKNFKNAYFFTRQFDIAKLENEPAARSKLVDILQEANPTEDRNVLEDAVEKMIGLNEATDAVFEDTAGISEISIGMQKERKDLFKNITDNTKLRDTGDGIDLLVPAHQAVRKYIDNIVKKTEYRQSVKTQLSKKDVDRLGPEFSTLKEIYEANQRKGEPTIISGAEATHVVLNRISDPKKRANARKAVQAMLGKAGLDMPGWLRTTQSYLLALNVATYLTFATVASLPDLAGPTLRSKEMFLLSKTFRTEMGKYFTDKKEMEQFARDVGVVGFDSIAHMYINAGELGYMTERTKFYTQKFFKYTGLEWYTNFTRIFAAGMGKQFLIKHANDNSAKSKEYLAELGVTAAEVKQVQAADFAFDSKAGDKVKQAIGRFVEESIVRPNAAERPVWASNPYTALIFQLKSFFYAYGKNIVGGVVRNTQSTFRRDGKISTSAMPAVYAATSLLPLAMIGMELRELIKFLFSPVTGAIDFNERTDALAFDTSKFRTNDMDYSEYLLESADRAGIFGAFTMIFPMMEAGRFGDEFYTPILGPTAQRVEDILKGDFQVKDLYPFAGSF